MRFIVSETKDPQELNREFEADVTPGIGKTVALGNGRTYRVMDIEYYVDRQDAMHVRAALRRLS